MRIYMYNMCVYVHTHAPLFSDFVLSVYVMLHLGYMYIYTYTYTDVRTYTVCTNVYVCIYSVTFSLSSVVCMALWGSKVRCKKSWLGHKLQTNTQLLGIYDNNPLHTISHVPAYVRTYYNMLGINADVQNGVEGICVLPSMFMFLYIHLFAYIYIYIYICTHPCASWRMRMYLHTPCAWYWLLVFVCLRTCM